MSGDRWGVVSQVSPLEVKENGSDVAVGWKRAGYSPAEGDVVALVEMGTALGAIDMEPTS